MERIPSPFHEPIHAPSPGLGGLGGVGVGTGGNGGVNPLRPTGIREELRLDPTRERLHSGNQNIDPFDISDIYAKYAPTRGDPSRGNVANEIDFNWKRFETYGKPDYSEQRAYHAQGWRPVQHHHFPGRFAPDGAEGPVVVKDMILMERPMSLTVKARNEEIYAATQAMKVNRQKVKDTPDGSMPRVVYADRSSREAIEIPE